MTEQPDDRPPWPPGGAASPGPPPTSPGTAVIRQVVTLILGLMAISGVAFIGLVGVTYLGTTAQPSIQPVGTLPHDAITAPPTTIDLNTSSGIAATGLVEELSTDWVLDSSQAMSIDETEPCAPDGWLTGAVDRYDVWLQPPSQEGTSHTLALSLTAYQAAAAARAELDRVRSEAYRSCVVADFHDKFPRVALPTVEPLSDDPLAPGVTYAIETDGRAELSDLDITVVVGELRAHIDCACDHQGAASKIAVARQVAAALAEVQGLPAPG